MNLLPYEDFRETEIIRYGTIASSASANKAPLFIKNELNKLCNYVKMKFSETPFEWDARASYFTGDYVSHNGAVYVATADNGNQEPPNSSWAIFNTDTLNLELKYVQIASTKYINLAVRNSYNMMRSHTNSTSAIMTPKNGLVPWDNGTSSNLGKSNLRFANIYTVNGHFSDVSTGTLSATTGTISTLNSTTVNATTVNGTASTAKYADLAEKYTSDDTYLPGDVLGFGGTKELTLFKKGMKLAGVVSTNPGYMLNSDIDGVCIALKGRVPCKITGTAKRGDYILALDDIIPKQDYTFEESKFLLGIAINDSIDGIVEIKV